MVEPNTYKTLFKLHKCCVIIPTYNNANTLPCVLDDVLQYTEDVIVVNDGSTDNTLGILKEYKDINFKSYVKNKGKGYAIRQGFKYAIEKKFDYAITIDSDGQHYAKDLYSFLKEIENNKKSIIIGARFLEDKEQPGSSSFANKFSNFWFKVETGLSLKDTQSGYRLYPIHLMKKMKWFTAKYEFEIEVLVRSAWKGINVYCVPIDVYYPKKEERITHFRPFKDFTRISILNTVLVFLAFLYFLPVGFIKKYRKKKIIDVVKNDILSKDTPIHIIAISIGYGVFIGILPIWGYQLIVGFLFAHLFRLKKSIFFIAANISLPPMIPFILYLSYVTGSFILGDGQWYFDLEINWETIKTNIYQYVVGAIGLSLLAGTIFGSVSYILLLGYRIIRK